MTTPLREPTAHPERSRAFTIIAAAILIAVSGDVLLRSGEPRLGFTLLVSLVAACALILGDRTDRERTLLIAGTAAAALGFVLRDAEPLYAIDLLSVLCMGALTVWRGSGRRLAQLEVLDAPKAAVLAVLTSLVGAPDVLRASGGGDSDVTERAARTARTRAFAIGTALALPPLLLVMVLLGAADSIFGSFLSNAVDFLALEGVHHVVVIVVLAWLGMGWLLGTLAGAPVVRLPEVRSPRLPFASASVGLYGLVLLLTLFLGTQARVLFGGAAYLSATAGLTVAEYAREGFFQLVVVAGIVLVTLLAADWLVVRTDETARRYRAAGTVLVGLVALLLLSAVTRMWLYVANFGLTIDRVMASSVMVWVVAAFVTFAATMLRGRGERFAPVMLLVTVGWVAALNAANPEAMVVRANVARVVAGHAFDATYHAKLSADALPALRAAAAQLPAAECAALSQQLDEVWAKRAVVRSDWRTLNLPYVRALDSAGRVATVGCVR
ncbi:MAG: DUF4173 domain-containing protein [Gemmatimonadota bacterium]|nr:DUF4173 domain-containing protein [Gemmatimonadota bacterium]